MTPVSLWVPLEVVDLEAAVRFYTVQLGLSEVDGWERDGERGVVLRSPGPAHVELVQPAPGAAPGPRVAFALEVPDAREAVAEAPIRFPRGHYGVTLTDPDGTPILVWSER
jgi:predicted enzyme related to lactoylglutathione lyase